ncbi:flagellar hook protein FlgE [Methylocaldum szegediense]|uniref:Flagellar hook protein FlgE n=1 Tax=Methylocaldum szegediense TaxID=73780 RepID=A0ABN8X691_9GAMM|nr:flagellar hook protein FlgE [Methylocaldum szegediense]CAI8804889.1 Flagellar hook protein FlgE [Methylocaldum szegediense]
MAFNTALSGLNAASNMLSVTGNNIANANTTGFKKSRSEFADVYASSLGGTPGAGVRVTNVAQQFTQGNLDFTENNLDLAISGEGFFVLGDNINNINERVYTRAGSFHMDREGYVVNHLGQPLLVYAPNGETVEEGFSTGVFQTLRLDSTQGLPKATSSIDMSVNLDSRQTVPATSPFNPDDPTSYTHATSVTIYDSLGNTHVATSYYVKGATPNTWDMYVYVDGQDMLDGGANNPTALVFDPDGKLLTVNGGSATTFTTQSKLINPSAQPIAFTIDLAGSTQLGSAFSVNTLNQDGLTIGRLTGVDIDDTGVVLARFSNGSSKPLGQVAMVRFQNPQGLSKLGDTTWAESANSGVPINGVAGTSSFGTIKAGALEGSNVDLAQQLVNLIIAQQAYQANAQTISTENTITQTLLNIR